MKKCVLTRIYKFLYYSIYKRGYSSADLAQNLCISKQNMRWD
jgi:hypothetical protein